MSSPSPSRPQVIYIAGAGHSGSTVLDIALGNHPEIVSVGELHKLHRSGWRTAENRRCSCGEAVHDCPRWSAIRTSWEARAGGDRLDEYIALQRRYESSFRCWPRLWRESRRRGPSFQRYLDLSAALYEAIVEVTGKPAVADSSKKPNRAFAMAQSDRLDVKILHLIRDGRGVVWSQLKPRKQDVEGGIPVDHAAAPSWRTASRWAFRNIECDWLARKLGPGAVKRISYERFTHEPQASMAAIGAFVGRDLTRLGSDLAAGREMSVVHLVAGNALRMGGKVVLRPVADWTSKLPARDRLVFWTLAGRLAPTLRIPEMTAPSAGIGRNVHLLGALRIGGAQRILRDLLPAIKRQGVAAELFVMSNRLDSFGETILAKFAESDIPVRRGPTLRLGARTTLWLRRQLLDLEPRDVLNIHLFNCERVYHLSRLLHRRRYRVLRTLHNTTPPDPGLNRWAFDRSDVRTSIACGSAIEANYRGLVRGEMSTVVSGIAYDWPRHDPRERAERQRRLGLDPELTHFVAAGRMGSKGKTIRDFQKGYDQLIRAWKQAEIGAGGGRLHLLGDGPLKAELEALAAPDDTIRFYGVVDNVHQWLGASDTYLMPSRWEGLPIAGMEATGTGIPCIFSEIDPLRELDYPAASYYTPEQVPELAERLRERLGKRDTATDEAVESARTRFGIDRMAREYVDVYARLT